MKPFATLSLKWLLLLGLLLATRFAAQAQVGVGIGTTAPDASAALDIVSSSKGALLPRVADATALASPATGLLVFQTNAPAGFYYNAGTAAAPSWQQLATAAGAAVTASNGLTKTGPDIAMGGTLTGSTTIAQAGHDFSLTGGRVGLGTAAPSQALDVRGNLRLGNDAGFNAPGVGNALEFVGPGVNSDPIGFHRTNPGNNISELHLALGDDPGGDPNGDKFVIGSIDAYDADQLPTATFTPQLTILSNGNLGIGLSPQNRLDVQYQGRSGTHPTGRPFYVTGDVGPGDTGFEFRHSNGTQGIGLGFNSLYAAGSNTDQNLNLLPKGAGSVGIGLTNPAALLDVNGPAWVRGTVVVDATGGNTGSLVNGLRFGVSNSGEGIASNRLSGGPNLNGLDLYTGSQPRLSILLNGGVGVGTTAPDASAALDIVSSTKGALLPRLTETARTTLPAPAPGLIVYQTNGSKPGFWYNAGTAATPNWLRLSDGGAVSYDPVTGLQVGPGAVGNVTTGTTSQNNASGLGVFRGDVTSARIEALYTAAQLTAAGVRPGIISGIQYYVNSKGSTQPYTNFTVQLGNVAATALTNTYTTGLTTVFVGNVTTALGAQLLVFNTSRFQWDGTSSVVVQTCFANATTSSLDYVLSDNAVPNSRLDATGCGTLTGGFSGFRPTVTFLQPGAYTLPATGGYAGQVLTQQAGGVVAFEDPTWKQSGGTVTPFRPGSRVGIGTTAARAKLELQAGADNTGANDSVALAFSYRSGGYRHFVRSRHNSTVSAAGNDLDFYLNSSGTTTGSTAPGTGNIQVMTLESNNGAPRLGIGTTSPAASLHVAGPASTVRLECLAGTGSRVVTADASGNLAATQAFPDGTNFIQNQTAATQAASFRISGNGLVGGTVGIGTTTPHGLLDLGSTVGSSPTDVAAKKLALYNNSAGTDFFGLGISPSALNLFAAANTTDGPKMTVLSNGNVGIGTSSPQARLHVSGSASTAPNNTNTSYFCAASTFSANAVGGTTARPVSAYFEGGQFWVNDCIVAGALNVSSDARIKHVIGLSDRAADLALLNKIRITDYTYIDQIANTSQVVKKVIAQEIQALLPVAVNTSTQAIPNVYEPARQVSAANGFVRVTTTKPHQLPASGGRMRFYTAANEVLNVEVTVVDAHTLRFASATSYEQLFVYGKFVSDFLSVDYDALAMLNVSATQELARQLREVQAQLRQQASRTDQAEAALSGFAQRLRALEAGGGQAQR